MLQTLYDTKSFSRSPQGTLEWRMHDFRSMRCVLWKDKWSVLLLSTHARPIQLPCKFLVLTILWRNGAIRESIQTSPIHHEYTTHMHRIDVVDQLHASYCSQNQFHKWWHCVCFFFYLTCLLSTCMSCILTNASRVKSRRGLWRICNSIRNCVSTFDVIGEDEMLECNQNHFATLQLQSHKEFV